MELSVALLFPYHLQVNLKELWLQIACMHSHTATPAGWQEARLQYFIRKSLSSEGVSVRQNA